MLCASLRGQASNDDSETLCNLLVQYFGTSVTGSNTVYRHTRSKNGRKCYLELKLNFKTECYEDTKASKTNDILQSSHNYKNRKLILGHCYNFFMKAFVQL